MPFTGADRRKTGYFEDADDANTFFLDEVGALSAPAQVKLLRISQEGEVIRCRLDNPTQGRCPESSQRRIEPSPMEIAMGRFREDLFYRLAVGEVYSYPL